jgi:hypothetical protein
MWPRWWGLLALSSLLACDHSTALHRTGNDAQVGTETDTVLSRSDVPADAPPVLEVASSEAKPVGDPPSDADDASFAPDAAVAPDVTATELKPADGPAVDAALVDTAVTDVAGRDGSIPSPAVCAPLRPLADKGVFTSLRAEKVFFSQDRSWLVLRVHVEDPPGVVHAPKLVRFALPSGEATVLSDSGGTAEPLGAAGAILLTGVGPSGTDVAIHDSTGLRTIATGVCDHAATPDGRRIYVLRDCTAGGTGALASIDATTGQVAALATSVDVGKLAVSPDGSWLAFVAPTPPAPSPPYTAVHLLGANGDSYAISSYPGVTYLRFLSDNELLFATTALEYMWRAHVRSEVLTHALGSGNTATPIAINADLGLFGPQISADGKWLLLAVSPQVDGGPVKPGLLVANPFEWQQGQTLASNLLPFWSYQLAINAFGFSAVRDYVVYITDADGLWSYAMSTSASRKLSAGGMFVFSPTRAEVAIRETVSDAGDRNSLRLVALDSGADLAAFAGDTLHDVQFLPDGRGLVFVATRRAESGSSSTLRFISASHPDSVTLAQWGTTLLSSSGPGPYTYPTGSYPIDPTGCFAIADVDGAPGPGTQLVLLPE